MRLIDADTAAGFAENCGAIFVARKLRDSKAFPEVVTRCKDCAHWDDDPDTYGADDGPKGKCMKSFEIMCADDFCSSGEPKEDAK